MAFSLKSLFRPTAESLAAYRLYGALAAQARRAEFYVRLGVADSPTGRYSMVALHGFLVMDRLARDRATAELAQKLFDAMFADMDRNLREMGVGDLSVGKKVKKLARHFYGMADAVRAGLESGQDELAEALSRNVYGDAPPSGDALRRLADYVRASADSLRRQPAEELVDGAVRFAPLPVEADHVVTG